MRRLCLVAKHDRVCGVGFIWFTWLNWFTWVISFIWTCYEEVNENAPTPIAYVLIGQVMHPVQVSDDATSLISSAESLNTHPSAGTDDVPVVAHCAVGTVVTLLPIK